MAMKKLTAAQAFELLKAVGVDAELVADDKDSDMTAKPDDATFTPTTVDDLILMVDEGRTPIISQKVLQAENANIHTSVTAKVFGGMRKAYIAEGVPAAELEGKSEKEMVKIARLHFSKNSDLDADAINTKMAEMITAHEAALTAKDSEWKGKYTQLESSLTRKQILDVLKSEYKEAKGIKPTANIDILSEDFLNHTEQNVNVKLGADGKSIELYNKSDNSRIMNAAGTNFASITERMRQFHEPRDQWHEDNRNISATAAMSNKLNLDTTVNKDGRIESGPSKQIASVEAWANADSTAA